MPTKLHFAAQNGDTAEVTNLIALGADVNALDENGNSPLKYASAEPYPDVLRVLISNGAQPTLADHRGFTPLHCVSGHGFYDEAVEMADILIQAGGDVNAKSAVHGFVPLHEARSTKIIDFLLSNGADPSIKNDAGLTPAEYLAEDDCVKESVHLEARINKG